MKIFEMFSGYGTASHALKQLGIQYECVGYSDIDKYANQCFKQNHMNERSDGQLTWVKELGDATKINPHELEDFDLLTAGFPCQAFSVAGKGLGELDTRGTLFNEIIKVAEAKNPRYMLLENVKGLLSKRHRETFIKITNELHRIGYYVKIRVLNTKDHGVPQNRERVWFACFKEKSDWEKFQFPENQELKIFLKDILEPEVDEKYYLSEKAITGLMRAMQRSHKPSMMNDDTEYTPTIDTRVGALTHRSPYVIDNRYKGDPRIYEDTCPTLTSHGNSKGGIPIPFIAASRGRYDSEGNVQQNLEPRKDGMTNSLTSVQKDNYVMEPKIIQKPRGFNKGGLKEECPAIGSSHWQQNNFLINDCRIRKLTPKECFRLQGFLNDEINLEGLSNTQRYKLAGNGQSVNVVKKIFERMFA